MACDEQKRLAATIKKIHSDLRSQCAELGINEAWKNHLENESTLKLYANSMSQLAEKYWTSNSTGEDRINWVASFCLKYFYSEEIKKWRLKEIRTIEALREQGIEISADLATTMEVGEKLEILDVGSSGNFFRKFDQFNLLPIDIAPSDDSVVYCDFLSVPIENSIQRDDKTIEALPANHFHAVVFSLLLEYLPTSEQRIRCCEKAYQVLRQEGILLIGNCLNFLFFKSIHNFFRSHTRLKSRNQKL